ncbi:MAG: transporter [Pseudomonadota bacterium]
MTRRLCAALAAAGLISLSLPALAHDQSSTPPDGAGAQYTRDGLAPIRADSHAPIGVMGDHMHKAGEWMFSYRFMHMRMGGNKIGTDYVSAEEIATTEPNRFFGTPGQPPTLRVVPTSMHTNMHMFGAMYAPTDWVTLMVMGNYTTKSMEHTTFQGAVGTTQLGTFETNTSGFGDTTVTALGKIYEDEIHHFHLNGGLSLPSGSITKEDQVLTPMGMTPTQRLPYAMQLGSGTVDLKPGLTYTGSTGDFGWGAQYASTIRLFRNSQDYALGNNHMLTAWGSYQPKPWISGSFRLTGRTAGQIKGIDSEIVAPVQTADPDNYGGQRLDASFGINLAGQQGVLRNSRLGLEFVVPFYQNLNGPQMAARWAVVVGVQKSF